MSTDPFDAFFAQALGGKHGPDPYQRAIATEGRMADLLCVPTGCGKTPAVVLGWLWRRLRHEVPDVRLTTPRRLVYCLPARALVEQVRSKAVLWLKNLDLLAGDLGVHYKPSWVESRIPVFTLMGGEERVDWQAFPEREAIIIGTQDMLLSRALNRGYGAYPAHWPVDFGMLNADCLWVFDEMQLMGPGRTTSAQLQLFAKHTDHLRLPPRHSIWMSATLGAGNQHPPDCGRQAIYPPNWMLTPERVLPPRGILLQTLSTAERESPRWDAEPTRLQAVIHAKKPLRRYLEGQERWTSDSDELPAAILSDAAERLTLVVVNTVARSRALFDKVQRRIKELPESSRPDIVLLHSRFRPYERTSAMSRVAHDIPVAGRIVISTQVLEAGMDLDAHRLFTELAPWPSLVQRFGRLNRRGKYKDAQAIVFDIPFDDSRAQKLTKKDDREKALEEARTAAANPYKWKDVQDGRAQLNKLGDVLPSLDQLPDVPLVLDGPVLRRFHVNDAFDTDPDLSGGQTDISGFVRARDRADDVYLLWRRIAGDPNDQPPVHPDEICRVPIHEFVHTMKGKHAFRLDFGKRRRSKRAWQRFTIADRGVRPGDTIMVELSHGGYSEDRGWLGSESGMSASEPRIYVAKHNGRRAWVEAGPGGVVVVADIDDKILGYFGRNRDPRSSGRRWMRLDTHLAAAEQRATEIVRDLVCPKTAERIALAARWHDVGKGLERRRTDGALARPFQEMLRSEGFPNNGHPMGSVLYAKSNRQGGKGAGFRHEVASALAYLQIEKSPDDLVAYLIMCHHGKVRLLPEPWDEATMRDANGVRPNDEIPAVALDGLTVSSTSVCLDPGSLLGSALTAAWQRRVTGLLREHGPFELAFLEGLMRVADWRAGS